MYKKILLTGVNGQVGHALSAALSEAISTGTLTSTLIALDRTKLDLTNESQIRQVVRHFQPDLIINPAAYTAVDKAESELELAYAINATAPRILAEEAAAVGARLIHFSTDYVYSGDKTGLYVEEDATQPLSVYGKSKLAGEEAIRAVGLPHLIFRTSWVYGAYGKNFMKTILRLAGEREELRIVADQYGVPTSSKSIAEAVLAIIQRWPPEPSEQTSQQGVYHLVNNGTTNWYEFAKAIVEEHKRQQTIKAWPSLKVVNIQAITTQDYPTSAARPKNSCLDISKLQHDFSVRLPDWRDALVKELQELQV